MAKTAMLATLGGQPQVITFALDALLQRGERVDEVHLLHLGLENWRTRQALERLMGEFANGQYGGRPSQLHRVPLALQGDEIDEISEERDAEITWQVVREQIALLKQRGYRLHLGVSGGPRMMALLVMSAAALLCDHQDTVWHLYTPTPLRAAADQGAILHVAPEAGVRLIRVPLAPWGAYFPALRAMAQAPQQAIAEQMGWLTAGQQERCRQVYEQLTERQRATLIAFAQGLTPQDVAEALNITLSTVNTYKTAILDHCRIAWTLEDSQRRLDFRFIREQFAGFLRQLGQL